MGAFYSRQPGRARRSVQLRVRWKLPTVLELDVLQGSGSWRGVGVRGATCSTPSSSRTGDTTRARARDVAATASGAGAPNPSLSSLCPLTTGATEPARLLHQHHTTSRGKMTTTITTNPSLRGEVEECPHNTMTSGRRRRQPGWMMFFHLSS